MSRDTSWHIACDRCGDGETHPEPLTNAELTERGWLITPDGDFCDEPCVEPDEDIRPIADLPLPDDQTASSR